MPAEIKKDVHHMPADQRGACLVSGGREFHRIGSTVTNTAPRGGKLCDQALWAL